MEQIGKTLQRLRQEQPTRPPSSHALRPKTTLVSKYGDRESFLAAYNPSVQRRICPSPSGCFFGEHPTLAALRDGYGSNAPVMWLIPQLYNLSEYCGCRDKLQGAPLEDCAGVIAAEFPYLKVSELMLFFHRFKAGSYGRFYGSVDPLVITTSLRTFLRERTFAYDRREQQERERRRDEERKRAVSWQQYRRMTHLHDTGEHKNEHTKTKTDTNENN